VDGAMEVNEFIKNYNAEKQGPYTARTDVKLITPKEYAKSTGLSEQAVRNQLRHGVLDGVQVESRWYVRVIDAAAERESEELKALRQENTVLKTQLDMIKNVLFPTKYGGEAV